MKVMRNIANLKASCDSCERTFAGDRQSEMHTLEDHERNKIES